MDAGLAEEARALTDTDWHIPRLYDFAEELGASTLAAHYSRHVVDLNPPFRRQAAVQHRHYGLYPDTPSTAGRSHREAHGAVRRGTHAPPAEV
ncbi:N-formylglutamate amidohydrolase [Pseudomonas aeruginosa]